MGSVPRDIEPNEGMIKYYIAGPCFVALIVGMIVAAYYGNKEVPVIPQQIISASQQRENKIKVVITRWLESQRRGENGAEYWEAGSTPSMLFAVTNWEIVKIDKESNNDVAARELVRLRELNLKEKELKLKIKELQRENLELSERSGFNSAPTLTGVNNALERLGEALDAANPVKQKEVDSALVKKALEYANKALEYAYANVRIDSSTKGGSPIRKIWKISLSLTNNEWKISYVGDN